MRGRKLLGASSNPLIVIEWIIAIVTLVGGAYLLSPFIKVSLMISSKSPFALAVASDAGIVTVAAVCLAAALLLIGGILKKKVAWRSASLFVIGLVRLYAVLAGILINGIFPLTWLSSFAIMLITFYIWGRIRKRGIE